MRLLARTTLGGAVLLLGACGNTSAQPTARPTQELAQQNPTLAPRPTATLSGAAPAATEQPAEPSAAAALPPPAVAGQPVLTLGRGAGADQIGPNATFRIGADGSIRLLDSENKRLLFFSSAGEYQNSRELAEANNPLDFIVESSGDLYVLDYAGDNVDRAGPVLHYGADGALKARIALGTDIFPTGIMLTANSDLMLINGDHYWVAQRNGSPIPAEAQALTQRKGLVTPRSPVAFNNSLDAAHNLTVTTQSVIDMQTTSQVLTAPGADTFFNIDRAMNVYVTSALTSASEQGIKVWRYSPGGELLGSAAIALPGCDFTSAADRRFYIDQAGAAWTLCITPETTTVSRYTLVDQGGAPLPEAASEPADVPWKPGANFSPG
jgi:hypothetical protein